MFLAVPATRSSFISIFLSSLVPTTLQMRFGSAGESAWLSAAAANRTVLIGWHFHTGCDHRAVGRHLTAAGCGTFGWNNSGVSSRAAVGRQQHLVVGTFDAAACPIALCTNHTD